ncbi:MAG: ornithine cyclodeaminase family protein [Chloroflexi bacterium]|nr:ornithine cyclodeaminase family protein [Chloroflexota bacterium]
MPTLFLSGSNIKGLLDMSEVIGAVEEAFRESSREEVQMPAKSYLTLERGDFRAMPASVPGAAGVKWVNVHPRNPSLGLPTVMATIILNDPLTGYPLSIMDATEMTAYRTGATAAIASKYLARPGAQTLGIVGAGRQAYTQIMAHAELFDLKAIRVFDPAKAAVTKLIEHFPQYPIKEASLEEAVASDILCTVTPARSPVVRREWVLPGTHINAIGADAAGKEELEPPVLKEAMVVVDDIRQATTSGEINVPIAGGLFTIDDIHATLAEVISGQRPGRESEETITVFDSTGIAIEDIAVARMIYEKAKGSPDYLSLKFVE